MNIYWVLLSVNYYYKGFICVYYILDELMVKVGWILVIINLFGKVVRIRNGIGIVFGLINFS